MNYQMLKAGDIREPNDEVRQDKGQWFHKPWSRGANKLIQCWTQWSKTQMDGHTLIPADLITFQYRRPLP